MTDLSTAGTAYAQAPPILREVSNVLALTRQLQQPGGHTPCTVREQRLRKAALLDRIALQEASEYPPGVAAKSITVATDAARKLARFDADHDTAAGPIGPTSPQWDHDPRAYVRQEYTTWHTSNP